MKNLHPNVPERVPRVSLGRSGSVKGPSSSRSQVRTLSCADISFSDVGHLTGLDCSPVVLSLNPTSVDLTIKKKCARVKILAG